MKRQTNIREKGRSSRKLAPAGVGGGGWDASQVSGGEERPKPRGGETGGGRRKKKGYLGEGECQRGEKREPVMGINDN